MIRVMFYTGISVLLASAVLLYLPICFSYILALLLISFFIILLLLRKKININGIKILTLITLIFVILGIYVLKVKVEPTNILVDTTATVEGTVVDWPTYNENYTTYIVKADKISVHDDLDNVLSELYNVKIRVSDVNKSNFEVFEKVKFEIRFQDIEEYMASSYSKGVYCSGYMLEKGESIGYNRPFYAMFFDLRNYVNRLIFDNINYSEATVATAVLMGDFEFLDDDFYLNSKITGVTHMLVVSGMHLGIIFQVLGAALHLLKVPKRIIALILLLAIFSVSAICGFVPSILRAGLTYFILALGMFFFQKPDPLNSLGIAATVVCFASPFSAGNVSFLLSFLSTFGLIFVFPIMYEKCERLIHYKLRNSKIIKGIIAALCQTLSATICTMPISVLVFGYISAVSLLVNVLVGYTMSAVLVLTLIIVVLLWIPIKIKVISSVLITLLCFVIRYSVFIINSFAKINNSVISTENLFLIPWAVFIIGLIFAVIKNSENLKEKARKLIKITSVLLICLSLFSFFVLNLFAPKTKIKLLSVGKGSAVLVAFEDKTVLIGSGDGKNDADKIKNELLTLGKTNLDALILPTLDKDLAGGAPALINEFSGINVCLPQNGEFLSKMQYLDHGNYSYYDKEASMTLLKDTEVLIYKDKGVIINFKEKSFVIMCGEYISDISKSIKNESFVLVCANVLPKDINNFMYDEIVFSGTQDIFSSATNVNAQNAFKKPITYRLY